MIIRVFDLETTGFPEEGKPSGVIQIGFTDVDFDERAGAATVSEKTTEFLVNPMLGNPTLTIDPGAKSAHHIIEEDLAPITRTVGQGFAILMKGADAFACHNREHDGHYFGGGGRPIICTLKAAKVVWPDAERHSNQFLRYWLGLPVDRQRADPAHHAGPDSYVTAHVLARLIAEGAGFRISSNGPIPPLCSRPCILASIRGCPSTRCRPTTSNG